MGNSKKPTPAQNTSYSKTLVLGAVVLLAAVVLFFAGNVNARKSVGETIGKEPVSGGVTTSVISSDGDLLINKSEISEIAVFIPYSAEGVKMEAIAVKAPDGTVRTALNTCQVCYNSGYGYYVQEDDELVCQNCGNRFKISQVEKIKGGCNPVPIMNEDKSDNGTTIVIPATYMMEHRDLFGKWKKI